MLSGKGNENSDKTIIGLIIKKVTLHVQHTFFVHFFAVVLHDYNVKLPETSSLHVLWRKCRASLYSCSIFFFSLPFTFTLHLIGGHQHFSFCCRRYKIFMLFFQQKNVSFFSLSLQISVTLFLVELHWPAAYFLFFSVFLLLYIPNCGHDNNINLSLIYYPFLDHLLSELDSCIVEQVHCLL